jgi:hypothetical protein
VVIVQNDQFEQDHNDTDCDPNVPLVSDKILECLRDKINESTQWEATTYNDSSDTNRNAIKVLRQSNKKEPIKLKIDETDENFWRTGTEYLGRSRPLAEYQEVDAIDPNAGGHVRIDFVLDDANTIFVQVDVDANSTAKKVNDELKEKLKGEDFKVHCSQSGICKVMKPPRKFRKILFTHTNPGVSRSATGMEGEVAETPTLSEWGLLALVLLLGTAGLYLLRRTRLRARA